MKEERRRSSVVERTLGKGEAVSSILTDGTDEPSRTRMPQLQKLKTFYFKTLANELAMTANHLRFAARPLLRWLLIRTPTFHFAKNALTLHQFFQNAQGLIHIVVANIDLHYSPLLMTRKTLCRDLHPSCQGLG